MKVAVIGCGRWGTFLAWYLNKFNHQVILYGRESSSHLKQLKETRTNGQVVLPESIRLTSDQKLIDDSDAIVISVDSQGLRHLMEELKPLNLHNKVFVLCMKGLEVETGERLTEIVNEYIDDTCAVAVWIGPGHVQEIYSGIPTCMTVDCENKGIKRMLVKNFSSSLIRFYYGEDLIGNEIGAAAKNVIGIAAGMLDGLNMSPLKGPLMARGTKEVARLIKALGGNEISAYGLCHLGDYQATIFSPYSHNRMFGEKFVKHEPYTDLAEGYYTVKAMCKLGQKYNVDLPICEAIYGVLFENKDPEKSLEQLFLRELKSETK